MTFAKIFGIILLFLGLAVIVYSLYSSYLIFTVKKPAPEIFKTAAPAPQPVQKKGGLDLQAQMESMLQEQLKAVFGQMLPSDFLARLLNLISWSMFAGILILAGGKISGIGVNLLKKG